MEVELESSLSSLGFVDDMGWLNFLMNMFDFYDSSQPTLTCLRFFCRCFGFCKNHVKEDLNVFCIFVILFLCVCTTLTFKLTLSTKAD